MHKWVDRTVARGAAVIGLSMLLLVPASSQQQRGQQQQVYTCAAIHQRCVTRSTGTYVSMCDGYYADAKKTGQWPAFGQNPAVPCRR